MDTWEMFSEMCRLVVESQSVFLDITITNGCLQMQLMPMNEEDNEDGYSYED